MLFNLNGSWDQGTVSGKVITEEVKKRLIDFNLSTPYLNGRRFHVNVNGILLLAKNLIKDIRKLWNKKNLADQNEISYLIHCAIWYHL